MNHKKEELAKNTEAFLAGYQANNVLLYGESGTGNQPVLKQLPISIMKRVYV